MNPSVSDYDSISDFKKLVKLFYRMAVVGIEFRAADPQGTYSRIDPEDAAKLVLVGKRKYWAARHDIGVSAMAHYLWWVGENYPCCAETADGHQCRHPAAYRYVPIDDFEIGIHDRCKQHCTVSAVLGDILAKAKAALEGSA